MTTRNNDATLALLRERLSSLNPQSVHIVDDSHHHAGHAGAREGGHFTLVVVAAAFAGQSRVARQRQVFALIGDFKAAGIHALALRALTPEEGAGSAL